MEKHRFVIAVVVLLGFGLIAAGCGSDADDEARDDPGAGLERGDDETAAPEDAAERGEDAAERRDEAAERGEEAAGGLDEADREAALRSCREQARSLPAGEERERALAGCEAELGG